MDHANAGLQRVERGVEHHFLPVDDDVALIAAGLPDNVHTEENFHQCGLACAVLTAEAQNLTGLQGEIDVGENLIAEEVLLNASHLQQRSI